MLKSQSEPTAAALAAWISGRMRNIHCVYVIYAAIEDLSTLLLP